MPRPRFSLLWKLPLFVAGLLLVVIGALCGAAFFTVRRSTEDTAAERLRAVNIQLVQLLQMQARNLQRRVRTLAADPKVVAYFHSRSANDQGGAFAAVYPATTPDSMQIAVEFLGPSGERIAATGPLAVEVEQLFAQSVLPRRGDSPDSSAVGRLMAIGDTTVFPTVALVAGGDQRLGYLVVWRRNSSSPRTSAFLTHLIGSEAQFYIGAPGGAWISQLGRAEPPPIPPADSIDPEQLLRYHRADGEEALAVANAIPGTPWYVVIEFPTAVVHAPANRFLEWIIAIGTLFFLLSLVAAWFVSRHLVTPLIQLTAATEAVGHADANALVPQTDGDELGRLTVAFNRMAARIEAEANARASSESQWRLLFERNPQPMWVCEEETLRFLAVNEAAVQQYGLSRDGFLERTLHDLRAMPRTAGEETGAGAIGEVERHLAKGGAVIEVEINHHPLFFAGVPAELVLAHNITARKTLENQIRQAQKMEAVGRLSGGVAHDFNNLLAVIVPYAELLRDEMPVGSRQAQDLDEILHAAERGSALTRQLLTFSKQQVLSPSVLDPYEAILGVERLLRRLIGEDIQLVTKLETQGARIRIDSSQFEQILVNLAVNARDAMPSGGHLVISASEIDLDPESVPLHGLPEAGRYVLITVADTGVGMDAATSARIFEPFFTTKPVGKGTGIGLATVYAIMTQCGGRVSVYSEPGAGTTFRLYFGSVEGMPSGKVAAVVPLAVTRGTETILLVEDDAAVRNATVEVLQRNGYDVVVAPEAEEALRLAATHPKTIHLVVSDVVMPRMGGPALLKILRERHPEIRALLISGYAGEALTARGEIGEDIPFLGKPFTVAALLTKMRQILDAAPVG